MIDTVTIGLAVGVPGGVEALVERRWDDGASGKWKDGVRHVGRWVTWGCGVGDDVVTMKWRPERGGWLTVTASIPRLIHGTNAELVTWGEWRTGLDVMRAWAMHSMGLTLPGVHVPGTWRYHRIDPVWAWATDPPPYLAALAVARLPGTVVSTWGGDVTWKAARGKATRGRAYDKARQMPGVDVDRPLRAERQLRSPGKRKPLVVGDRELGPWVPMWDEAAALGVVRQMMAALGLDRPIQSKVGALAVLRDVYGRTHGGNLAGHLALAAALGGWHLVDRPASTVARWQRELRAAGIVGVSLVGELPALGMPE